MENTFTVVFKNSKNESYKLDFQVYKNDISEKWFSVLKDQIINCDNKIYETDRLYGFPNDGWNEEKIISELNICIEQLNLFRQVIDHYAYVGMPQEHLNILHHYFENLRGGVLSPGEFWELADEQTKQVLGRYNVLIHRAEDYYRSKSNRSPRIVCTFKHRERFLLEDDDYEHFTVLTNFGEVYINYCEVGKPLQDVFKDDDDIVGEDNIRPLRYYSPDFRVHFYKNSQTYVDNFLKEIDDWWNQNHNYLTALGFVKNDPKNAIGHIPVARIVNTELNNRELINLLANYNILDRVELSS